MSRSNNNKSAWLDSMPDYSNYYKGWDPVKQSKAAPSQWDALPNASAPPTRSQSSAGGLSRYRREPGTTSQFRETKQTKHEKTSRDWGFTNSGAGSRQWEPEVLNRSEASSTRRPATKKESTLFNPGVDLGSYAGGYGGSSSGVRRSYTVRPSSKRDSSYRDGTDLSSYDGGRDYGRKSTKSSGLKHMTTVHESSNRDSTYRAGVDLSSVAGGPSMKSSSGSRGPDYGRGSSRASGRPIYDDAEDGDYSSKYSGHPSDLWDRPRGDYY